MSKSFSGVRQAPDEECDRMISALKLVTHLLKGNNLGVAVKGPTESSKNRFAEAWQSFIAVDNARASP